jgi:hypothetical protein
MLLFKKPFFAGLESGAITLTFRRWQKPHVRPGGRYRCHPIGVLEVDAISKVTVAAITEDDAARAGFPSRDALVAYLAELGPLDDGTELTPDDVATITRKLAAMDRDEPWTRKTLVLIDKHPRVAASKLAAKLGRETQPFKIDVRKLKKLGLTQSFEVGYELSPRGRAYLAKRKPKRT